MKKLFFILLVTLSACGSETSRFDKPFIVKEIYGSMCSEKEGDLCVYIGRNQEGSPGYLFASVYPRIIAPCGLYQIGDTIMLNRYFEE